jgi:hypothetical protein
MHRNSGNMILSNLRNILPQSLGRTSQLKETNIELIHEGENQAFYHIQYLQKQPDSKEPCNAFIINNLKVKT